MKLSQARKSNERAKLASQKGLEADNLSEKQRKPHNFVQKISPFGAMRPLRNAVNSSPPSASHKRIKFGQVLAKSYTKPANSVTEYYDAKVYHDDGNPIPKFTTYISTQRNVLIEDNKHRTFLPYHGEDFVIGADQDYARMEAKIIQNQRNFNHMSSLMEKAAFFSQCAHEFLAKAGTDVQTVLYYLLDPHNAPPPIDVSQDVTLFWYNRELYMQDGYYEEEDDSDSVRSRGASKKRRPEKQWNILRTYLAAQGKIDLRKLAAAGLACEAFMKVTGTSLWHVVRQSRFAQDTIAGKPQESEAIPLSKEDTMNPDGNPLGTYTDLVCLVCKA